MNTPQGVVAASDPSAARELGRASNPWLLAGSFEFRLAASGSARRYEEYVQSAVARVRETSFHGASLNRSAHRYRAPSAWIEAGCYSQPDWSTLVLVVAGRAWHPVVDPLSVLMDLAQVLKVDPGVLLARPWKYAPNDSMLPDELEPTRRYLSRYRHLHDTSWSRVDHHALGNAVASAHAAYKAARHGEVAILLPGLLGDVDMLRPTTRRSVGESTKVYVSAYLLAVELLRKLGALDLAMWVVDRAAFHS